MGLGVSIFLAMILYVGIGAISGLEVSYMAFSKEISQIYEYHIDLFALDSAGK